MVRRLTPNEKSCNPFHDYIFERNGYKTLLTESKFQQLAKEILDLLKPEQKFCECKSPTGRSVTEDFEYQICDTCGRIVN